MSWIESISKNIGDRLSEKAEYSKEKKEILVYMIMRLITNIIFLLSLLCLSYIFDTILTTFISLLAFLLLRRCFGGWHVQNSYLCLAISIIVPLITGFLATKIYLGNMSLLSIYVATYVIVLRVGVVDNKNKILKESRKEKFKEQGMITIFIILIINMLLQSFGYIIISNAILLGLLLNSISLLLGKNKQRKEAACKDSDL